MIDSTYKLCAADERMDADGHVGKTVPTVE
jgi:hypothetical protein